LLHEIDDQGGAEDYHGKGVLVLLDGLGFITVFDTRAWLCVCSLYGE